MIKYNKHLKAVNGVIQRDIKLKEALTPSFTVNKYLVFMFYNVIWYRLDRLRLA